MLQVRQNKEGECKVGWKRTGSEGEKVDYNELLHLISSPLVYATLYLCRLPEAFVMNYYVLNSALLYAGPLDLARQWPAVQKMKMKT